MVAGVTCGMGLIEAPMGSARALERAAEIEPMATHTTNAELIRMLYHLWQGDARSAQASRHKVETLRIESSARQWFEGGHLMAELVVHEALIAHSADGAFHVTGIALLRMPEATQFHIPAELSAQLSHYWYGVGDATSLATAAQWTRA